MADLNVTSLKAVLAERGYKDIKNLSPTSFGVVVPKTRVDKVVPDLVAALKQYNPKVINDRELRVGTLSVFAKNANMQRGVQAFTHGRGNEFNLMTAVQEYITDYGKPMDVEFRSAMNGVVFRCNSVLKVAHVGAKNVFQRNKANLHFITDKMQAYPLSVKDENASFWESADSYWGAKGKDFLDWAVYKKKTKLVENGSGGFNVVPSIAVAATDAEIRDVVFGADIYGKGAIIVQKFSPAAFKWDFDKDVLIISCKLIITNERHVKGDHEVFFQIRPDRTRSTQHLYKGLRVLATMKRSLQGNAVFERSQRSQMGF
jgi:hypothetical protein